MTASPLARSVKSQRCTFLGAAIDRLLAHLMETWMIHMIIASTAAVAWMSIDVLPVELQPGIGELATDKPQLRDHHSDVPGRSLRCDYSRDSQFTPRVMCKCTMTTEDNHA
jgi:hypothetical protein